LIIRSSKQLLLTNKGKEFYRVAEQFNKTVLEIFDREGDHPLKIGTLHGLLENWLRPFLVTYAKKHLRSLRVEIGDQISLKNSLAQGQYDLIFTTENIQSELISSLELFDEELVLISATAIKDLSNIEKYTWIVYNQHDNIFRLGKQEESRIVMVDSITSIIHLTESGVGIAVVPAHVIPKDCKLEQYHLSPLDNSKLYLATLSYQHLPNYIQEFTDLITDSFAN
jgi:DNA-binding transcriptional LysR family regulator